MPYYSFNCQTCGKHKVSFRSKKRLPPKFCSFFCRGCTLKFQWKTATEKQVRERVLENYENYVIKKEGCFDWKGSFDKDGYAILGIGNTKYRRASRVSWYLKYGSIPEGIVAHTCDNPRCSNVLHLFITDAKGNSRDSVLKGRTKEFAKNREGEKCVTAKLKNEDIVFIRAELNKGVTGVGLAKKYNVSTATISKIYRNKTWKHVPCPSCESQQTGSKS